MRTDTYCKLWKLANGRMVASRAVEVAPLGGEGVTEQVVEEMEVVVEEICGVTEQVEAATVTGMAVVVHE